MVIMRAECQRPAGAANKKNSAKNQTFSHTLSIERFRKSRIDN